MEMRGWLLTLAYSTWSISASPSWNEAGTPDHFWSNSEGSKGSNVSTVQGPFFGGTLHTTVSMPYHLLRVNKVPTRMHWIISHSAPNIYVSITRIPQLVPPAWCGLYSNTWRPPIGARHSIVVNVTQPWTKNQPYRLTPLHCSHSLWYAMAIYRTKDGNMLILLFWLLVATFCCLVATFVAWLRAIKPLLLSSWCCFCFPKSGSQNAKKWLTQHDYWIFFSKINGPLNLNLWSLKFSYWGILASLNRLNQVDVRHDF